MVWAVELGRRYVREGGGNIGGGSSGEGVLGGGSGDEGGDQDNCHSF